MIQFPCGEPIHVRSSRSFVTPCVARRGSLLSSPFAPHVILSLNIHPGLATRTQTAIISNPSAKKQRSVFHSLLLYERTMLASLTTPPIFTYLCTTPFQHTLSCSSFVHIEIDRLLRKRNNFPPNSEDQSIIFKVTLVFQSADFDRASNVFQKHAKFNT